MKSINKWILLLSLFFGLGACTAPSGKEPPRAKAGKLDLSDWDFDQDGLVRLQGEWKFKWMVDEQEFIKPEFDDHSWDTTKVPASWIYQIGKSDGYGWMRLKIKLRKKQSLYAFIKRVGSSYRLYANGVLIMENGRPGNSKQETFALQRPSMGELPEHQEITLAWKISNFQEYYGGAYYAPKIGNLHHMSTSMNRKNYLDLLVLGIILIIGIYHFILWLGRREDKGSLLFCLFCLEMLVRLLAVERWGERMFPGADLFEIRSRIEIATVFSLTAPVISTFFCYLFPRQFSRLFLRIIYVSSVLLALFCFIIPSRTSYAYLWIHQLGILSAGLWSIYAIIRAALAKERDSLVFIAGLAILVFAMFNDVLHATSIIHTAHVTPVGLVVFIFFQSAILAGRFARTYHKSAKLTKLLDEVHTIGISIAKITVLQELLDKSLAAIVKLVVARRGSIFLYDPKVGQLVNSSLYGWSEEDKVLSSFVPGEGVSGQSFQSAETMVLNNVNNSTCFIGEEGEIWQGSRSLLTIPLKYQDKVYGVINIQDKLNSYNFSFAKRDIHAAETMASTIGLQIKNLELLKETAEKVQMDLELKTARAVQTSLFPQNEYSFHNLGLAGYFTSATETGGDWYGYFTPDDRYLYVFIGDVTGHGAAAALVTSGVRSACYALEVQKKLYPQVDLSPTAILTYLHEIVKEIGKGEFAMTFFVACYDSKTHELTFSNAGHNFPLLYIKEKNKIEGLFCRGNSLGSISSISLSHKFEFEQKTRQLNPGDFIVFYTDGLTECENDMGQEYGKVRFRKSLLKFKQLSASDLRDKVIKEVDNFRGDVRLKDDITLVVTKISE